MNNLAKITKLLSRGEKIIVVNEQADPQFVVMNIYEYEKFINSDHRDVKGLTEEELLVKINRDIAIWKSMQEVDETAARSDNFIQNIRDIGIEEESKDKIIINNLEEDNDDKYYFEPVDVDDDDDDEEEEES